MLLSGVSFATKTTKSVHCVDLMRYDQHQLLLVGYVTGVVEVWLCNTQETSHAANFDEKYVPEWSLTLVHMEEHAEEEQETNHQTDTNGPMMHPITVKSRENGKCMFELVSAFDNDLRCRYISRVHFEWVDFDMSCELQCRNNRPDLVRT